jgi:hypothetical protein
VSSEEVKSLAEDIVVAAVVVSAFAEDGFVSAEDTFETASDD